MKARFSRDWPRSVARLEIVADDAGEHEVVGTGQRVIPDRTGLADALPIPEQTPNATDQSDGSPYLSRISR